MTSYETTAIDPSFIKFEQSELIDLETALKQEWLETNGIGGFASGTLARIRTRRYHGLLFAATKPPVGRTLLLNAFESSVTVNGERFETSSNQYPGVVHPTGYKYLTRFRLNPWPVWTYRVGDVVLESAIWMVHGENTTVIEYTLVNAPNVPVTLELRPIVTFRDYHSLAREQALLDNHVELSDGLLKVTPKPDMPSLYLGHNSAEVALDEFWYRRFEYLEEQARGHDYLEDGFSPFGLSFNLNFGSAVVIASTQPHPVEDLETLRYREAARRMAIRMAAIPSGSPADSHVRPLDACEPSKRAQAADALSADPLVKPLVTATAAFIVARGAEHETVIAGYPWFTDWGRDTFISLTGLTLVTGRFDTARNILQAFAAVESQGLIPNRFQDTGEEPEYNTVDGTLWYVYAVGRYLDYTEDLDFVKEHLYPTLKNIFHHHFAGTRYNIKVDDDGLLAAGEVGKQLTWMDAKVGDWVVTPRMGKPVEIQGLWYNALQVMASVEAACGDAAAAATLQAEAQKTAASFNQKFWNAEGKCFYDVLTPAGPDGAIRPNQVLALAMPYCPADPNHARVALATIKRELLTPYGLRTLAPQEPGYTGRYQGGPRERDGAYHQGTVWPFLLGSMVTAYLRFYEADPNAASTARNWLAAFETHLKEAGLGQISEIFDGDEPHTPRGCIAQAWSVAEIYRCLVEDIHGLCPPVWKQIQD
ncbi:MAG: amylo-alpha-1,6-glucosidase [Blastocatellia bacterium]|nr:amylo-alpha-1,6-glucosidase [Blastocatellia bacterium]